MSASVEVAVIGGGLAGTLLVRALTAQGVDDLVWFDADDRGRGSAVPCALVHPFAGRSFQPRPGVFEAWAETDRLFTEFTDAGRVRRAVLRRYWGGDGGQRLRASWSKWSAHVRTGLQRTLSFDVTETSIAYGPVFAFEPGAVIDAVRDSLAAQGVRPRTDRVVELRRRTGGSVLVTDGVSLPGATRGTCRRPGRAAVARRHRAVVAGSHRRAAFRERRFVVRVRRRSWPCRRFGHDGRLGLELRSGPHGRCHRRIHIVSRRARGPARGPRCRLAPGAIVVGPPPRRCGDAVALDGDAPRWTPRHDRVRQSGGIVDTRVRTAIRGRVHCSPSCRPLAGATMKGAGPEVRCRVFSGQVLATVVVAPRRSRVLVRLRSRPGRVPWMGDPSIRASIVHETIRRLDARHPDAEARVRERIPQEVQRAVDEAHEDDWIPAAVHHPIPTAVCAVLGDDARAYYGWLVGRHLESPRFLPIYRALGGSFGINPGSFIKATLAVWPDAYRDFGEPVLGERGPQFAVLEIQDCPSEVFEYPAYIETWAGTFGGFFDLSHHRGQLLVESDPSEHRLRFAFEW